MDKSKKSKKCIGIVWTIPDPGKECTIVWLKEYYYKYTGTGLVKLKLETQYNYLYSYNETIKVITNNLQLGKILLLGVPEYLTYVLSPQFEIDASHPMSEVS